MDKGASWIHGARPGHPIKQLADKFNLTTFATDELDPIYYSNRTEAGEKAWFAFSRVRFVPDITPLLKPGLRAILLIIALPRGNGII